MQNFHLVDPYFLPHSGCDIHFSIGVGHCLVLIGENGLGKTSLLQHFYSKLEISKVIIEQKDLDHFYDRTLGEVREIFFTARGYQINKTVFRGLWESFGLTQKEERCISSLSGGESQSLKLVCGLSREADFYFMDEPSQFLDERRKKLLGNCLSELKQNQKSVLIVEHDLSWIPPEILIQELKLSNGTISQGKSWTT